MGCGEERSRGWERGLVVRVSSVWPVGDYLDDQHQEK